MARYVLHRLGRALAVLAAVAGVLFVALELQLGGTESALCGAGGCPASVRDEVVATFALDRGLGERALAFATAAVTFDLGPSLAIGRPAASVASEGVRDSAILVTLVLALDLALLAAVAVAASRSGRRWLDATTSVLGLTVVAVPLFWTGSIARAAAGPGPLPAAVVLALGSGGLAARQVYDRVRDGLDASHVRLARTYGVPERRIVLQHGLRPAVPRALESLATSVGVVLAGLVLLEPVAGRLGVGSTLTAALVHEDRPVILSVVLLLVAVFVAVRSLLLVAARLTEPPRRERWAPR